MSEFPTKAATMDRASINSKILSKFGLSTGLLVMVSFGTAAQAQDGESRLSGLRFPQIFRKAEPQPAPAATKKVMEENRFIIRAKQLMVDARRFESLGQYDAAFETATKAQSIYEAALRTTNAEWPANEQTPNEYIKGLEKRLAAVQRSAAQQNPGRASVNAAPAKAPQAPAVAGIAEAPAAQPRTASRANSTANVPVSNFEPQRPQRPVARTEPTTGVEPTNLLPQANAIFDLTKRSRQVLETVEAARDVAGVITGDEQHPSGTEPATENEVAQQQPTKTERSLNVARSVLDRLDNLQTWQPVSAEKPAQEPVDAHEGLEPPLPADAPDAAGKASKPSEIPEQIESTSGIADSLVGPIPTHIERNHRTQAGPLEIGGPNASSPNEAKHGSTKPLLSSEPEDTHGTALLLPPLSSGSLKTEPASANSERSLWLLGTVQTISTFLGVLLAAIVVLATRKSFTQQAAVPAATSAPAIVEAPQSTPAPAPIAHAQPVIAEEPATTLPSTPEPAPVREVASQKPALRVVSAANDDEAVANEAASREAEVVKSVFEQNVKLMESLHNLSDSAAA